MPVLNGLHHDKRMAPLAGMTGEGVFAGRRRCKGSIDVHRKAKKHGFQLALLIRHAQGNVRYAA